MREKFRKLMYDALLMAALLATFSAAFYGYSLAERYRALTTAYIEQSEQLIQILNRQNGSTPDVESKAKPD